MFNMLNAHTAHCCIILIELSPIKDITRRNEIFLLSYEKSVHFYTLESEQGW